MSFDEIKKLRKEGKLEEALQIALAAYQQNSEDIWNKRSLAWIYYDFAKSYAQKNKVDNFLEIIQKIKELELPKDEKMIFDNLIFAYLTLLKHLYKQENINYSKAQKIKASLSGLPFTVPSQNFSLLIDGLHKTFKGSNYYPQLTEKSFFKFLRDEDFLPTEYNGKKIMPLAEKIYTAYCKALVKGELTFSLNTTEYKPNKAKITNFLPKLQSLIEQYPDYTYLPYFKAKMEILLGNDALKTFLPFAKKKQKDYWVWQLLSEILCNDEELEFACLCKALSLNSQEKFWGNIRINLAQKFIDKQLFNEAKTEIESIIAEKTKNKQKIPNKIKEWTTQEWYQKASKKTSNNDVYRKHISLAENILFSDIEEEIIVVQKVNKNNKILNFIKNKQKTGFFKYEKILQNPQIGDVLTVRLEAKDNGFYKLLSAKKGGTNDCLKKFAGKIKITPKGFGFVKDVEDIFISSEEIKKNNIKNGQQIHGKAVLSFDKKKQKWSFSGIVL